MLTPERSQRAYELFLLAAALPVENRAAYLAEKCAGDEELRREVESRLRRDCSGFVSGGAAVKVDIDGPCPGATISLAGESGSKPETDGRNPSHIGSYRLLEVLGQGGMGIVYLAEQTQPIQRRVALKVIKLGMDSRQVTARFEAERQVLAILSHPGIAKIYDAGTSEQGQPYFVMEYVPGKPITEYCDLNQLSTRKRLALFAQICDAVQHAHQKAIIHRDLKPSNILVMVQDGQPLVKIIDFGVAKALNRAPSDQSFFTEHGMIIGTLEYMSPEQAEMSTLDIDTRADIYSLGVILYQLLTSVLPFDAESLRRAGYAEIQRIIREFEPERPSTRISHLGGESSEIARKRGTGLRPLARQLSGDLDWITMKALEKDRTRRYASASEFASDVRRYLEDEPVLAGPPSAIYRVVRMLRRNRSTALSAAIVVAVLAGAELYSWVQGEVQFRSRRAAAEEALAAAGASSDAPSMEAAAREVHLLVDRYPSRAEAYQLQAELVLLQAKENTRWARKLLGEAQSARIKLREALAALGGLKRAWKETAGKLEPWQPEWERGAEIEAWDRYQSSRIATELLYNEAQVAFQRAQERAPSGSAGFNEVSAALREFYREGEHHAQEYGPRPLDADHFRRLVSALTIDSVPESQENRIHRLRVDPADAEVYCFCYTLHESRLIPLAYDPVARKVIGDPFLRVDRVLDPHGSPFQLGDRIVSAQGVVLKGQRDLAAALKGVARGQIVLVRVRRADQEVTLEWDPFPAAKEHREPFTVGRLVSTREQFGFTLDGYPLDLLDGARVATPAPGQERELRLPLGSYLLFVRAPGHVEARVPLYDPIRETEITVRLPRTEEMPPGFVFVAGSRFGFGGDPEAYDSLDFGNAYVEDVFLSRLEVTLGEWREFLNDPEVLEATKEDGGWRPRVEGDRELLQGLKIETLPLTKDVFKRKDGRWEFASSIYQPDFPALEVNQLAARLYCRWLTRKRNDGFVYRLPTNLEWEKAARGADRRSFVWGEYLVWAFCRSLNGKLPGMSTRVGTFPEDESVFGVRDLAGSVFEWTSDLSVAGAPYYAHRGGSFASGDRAMFRAANVNGLVPTQHYQQSGFRLAASRRAVIAK